jgi:sugar lactone lactonase YvrE
MPTSKLMFEGDRVEVAHEISAELGEGSLWHEDLQCYLHVDIYGPSKMCKGPAVYLQSPYPGGAPTRCLPMKSFTGTVVPRKSGGLLVALKDGIYSVDVTTGEASFLSNPDGIETNRWNDGKCSPEGRFFGGTMGEPGKVEKGVGSLYVLNTDMTTRKVVPNVTISNGLAWDVERKLMYYIDTPTGCVHMFDYDSLNGEATNQRVAFSIPEGTGHPDGCCIDSEGNLWIAQWGGWRVVCYNPSNGNVIAEVKLPAAHVSSCTFGGPGLGDLYITTAKEHLSEEERAAQPHAGDCFIVRNIGFKGVPACSFLG